MNGQKRMTCKISSVFRKQSAILQLRLLTADIFSVGGLPPRVPPARRFPRSGSRLHRVQTLRLPAHEEPAGATRRAGRAAGTTRTVRRSGAYPAGTQQPTAR